MSGFKPYPAYKDSRVEWLGEVPEHWNVCRMAHLEQGGDDFVSGPFGSSLGSADYVDEGIPVIRGVNTTLRAERKFVEEDFVFVTEEKYADLCRCNAVPGDLIFTARGTVGKVALVPGSVPISLISPNQLRFRPRNEKVIAEYFFYMFSSENLLVEVILSSDSVAQPNMNLGSLKAIKVMLPPSCEQTQIARFLDHETARIDALIEEQQRLIELLKEKRQAVISHAVTKGLDPTVPMKDSGVEWLGEVPAHWDVMAIKWLSPVLRGASPRPIDDPKYFDESGEYAWVRIADVSASDGTLTETAQTLSALGSSLSVKVEPGDMFLSIAGTVGKPCITQIKACIHDGFVYFPGLKIDNKFLYRIFEVGTCYGGLGKMGTQLNLNTDTVGGIQIGVPPDAEIARILEYIDHQSSAFDSLIGEAAKGVELLQERRSALISAAVTGKIDVRNWQPPAGQYPAGDTQNRTEPEVA